MPRDRLADGPPDPAGRGTGWRAAEILSLPAGWAVAVAALLAAVPPGGRAAGLPVLSAVLAWWVAVVAIVRSDLRHFLIPDEASAVVAALGLAAAAGVPLLADDGPAAAASAVLQALSTGAGAFALFWLVGLCFRRFGRDALGFGDVKLAGASAVWLTPGDAAVALEVAALGAIAALVVLRRGGGLRDTAVPFGAFLAPAAWLVFVLAPILQGGPGGWPW